MIVVDQPEHPPAEIPAAEVAEWRKKVVQDVWGPRKYQERETELPIEQVILPYGVGIDTHKKFIQVCVLIKNGEFLKSVEREFRITWKNLGNAADWINQKLKQEKGDAFKYTIESTGCYHIPVLLAFKGFPSVVNPLLATKTHRKTDVLDARMLARQAITGLWPKSFLPSVNHATLRILNNEHREAQRNATRTLLRANNIILRYGHTIASELQPKTLECIALMEHLAMGRLPRHEGISSIPLSAGAQNALSWALAMYEQYKLRAKEMHKEEISHVEENTWPQKDGMIDGKQLLKNLMTVPGVGELTAVQWLAQVGDPNRFMHPAQVAAFAGTDPSLKVSAGKVTETTRRRGNKALHSAVSRAAIALVARPREPFGEWRQSNNSKKRPNRRNQNTTKPSQTRPQGQKTS